MNSFLYRGRVRHRRFEAGPREFSHGLYLAYLDLDELPALLERTRFLSDRGPSPLRFRRADYFGDPGSDLRLAVLDRVESELGWRPDGPVRLLTHLRTFGFCFNPVSFYFCFPSSGSRPDAVLADVHNTPWGERRAYVLPWNDAKLDASHEKRLHVSPFLPMDMDYRWRMSAPGQRLSIHVETVRRGRVCLDAALTLERHPLDSRTVLGNLVRFPWITARVVLAIYWQAFMLWLRRTPFHPHPRTVRQEQP